MIEVEVEFVNSIEWISRTGKSLLREKVKNTATLRDLLKVLSPKYEQARNIVEHEDTGTDYETIALINGKYPSNGLSTRLSDKDKVVLLPLVTGGS